MPRVVFHHIDKCAGTSVLNYLQNFFSPDECVFIEEYCEWTNAGTIELDANLLARMHFLHDPYGTRSWLDGVANARTMCFFREPFDRLVSNWWMVHRWTDEEAASFPSGQYIRDLARNNPEQFFSSDHPQCLYLNWNRIACHLACAPNEYRGAWQSGLLDSSEFREFVRRRAEETLRSLSFIGFQEDFDRSLSAMQLWLSLPSDQPQPLNVHGSGQRKPVLNEDAQEAIEEFIDLDKELVLIAWELYQEQLDRFERNYGEDFKGAAEHRYREVLERPAGWTIVNMAQPLNGVGWHCRERNGSKYSRWIGPNPKATIDVPFRKDQDIFVRFRVTNILTAPQVDRLALWVDGEPADLHRWLESTFVVVFDAVVPRRKLKQSSSILQLTFDCSETILAAEPSDGRRLGLEICEIELGPKDWFILQTPGTPMIVRGQRGNSCSRSD